MSITKKKIHMHISRIIHLNAQRSKIILNVYTEFEVKTLPEGE